MRNIAVHEYFGVDNMIVWETLQKNLPPLLSSRPHAPVDKPRSVPYNLRVLSHPVKSLTLMI